MSNDLIQVQSVLAGLIQTPERNPLDAGPRESLEWLCRKIQVGKRVAESYQAGWKKNPGAKDLAVDLWPSLIGLLLDYAEAGDMNNPDAPEEQRGLGLKFLNAAAAAIDLAEKAGANDLDDAKSRTDRLFEELAR